MVCCMSLTNKLRDFAAPGNFPDSKPWPPSVSCQENSLSFSQSDFNESAARESFGDEYFEEIRLNHTGFKGDWWDLCFFELCLKCEPKTDLLSEEPKGKKLWNAMCAMRQLRAIHLEGMSTIANVNMSQYNFDRAYFKNTRFTNIAIFRINTFDVFIDNCHFTQLKFDGSFLSDIRITGSNIDHCQLNSANIGQLRILDTNIEHSEFKESNFFEPRIKRSKLVNSDFTDTDWIRANFGYSQTTKSCFDKASVHGAIGLRFDQNSVDRIRIEGNAHEPWSILRSKYTGPNYILNLSLLVLFLIPFGIKAIYLKALSSYQQSLHELATVTSESIDPTIKSLGLSVEQHLLEFEQSHQLIPAILVLLGWLKGPWFVALTAVVLLYQALRGLLTYQVSSLRESEERSQVTPSLQEYYYSIFNRPKPRRIAWHERRNPILWIGLYPAHRVVSVLFWVALGVVILNTADWLWDTWLWVPMPK